MNGKGYISLTYQKLQTAFPKYRTYFSYRLLMIIFVGLAGGDTDTSRDYEYTDWSAVEAFAERFT